MLVVHLHCDVQVFSAIDTRRCSSLNDTQLAALDSAQALVEQQRRQQLAHAERSGWRACSALLGGTTPRLGNPNEHRNM